MAKWNNQTLKEFIEQNSECKFKSFALYGEKREVKLSLLCTCGEVFERHLSMARKSITNKGYLHCKKCSKIIQSRQYLKDFDTVKRRIDEDIRSKTSLITTKDTYKGTAKKLSFICECGNRFERYCNSFFREINGCFCLECSRKIIKNRVKCVFDKSIAITNPEFAKSFVLVEDTLKYSCQSNQYAEFKCKECNYIIGKRKICNVYNNNGVSCPKCSDGKSYPEKFMFSLLQQLEIDFTTRVKFEWSKNKEYDFYIPSMNCIIETHGGQHFDGSFESAGGRTLDEEIENDMNKKKLASKNNIHHYYEIDCRFSDMEFISRNILNSGLSIFFNLHDVDWLKCHKDACSSYVKDVCDMWNKGIHSTMEIGEKLKLNFNTVRKYLKMGEQIGWCDYHPSMAKELMKKPVLQITKDGDIVKRFESIVEASAVTRIISSNIARACNSDRYTAGGYIWSFIIDYSPNKINEIINSIYKAKDLHYKKICNGVVQLTDEKKYIAEYKSIIRASNATGINKSSIGQVCCGKRSRAGGYKWMYKEDYDKYIEQKNNNQAI